MAEVTTPEATTPEAAPDEVYADLIEALRRPIDAAKPCGDDVRYEAIFQELKTEIDRIGSASADVDYDRIVELAQEILYEKSKDLNTAGYLALGLVRTKGVAGVAEGLVVVGTLVETFWEDVHPRKSNRRRNALQFAADKLKEWLEQRLTEGKPTEQERPLLEQAQARLATLQTVTTEALQDEAPAWSGLRMVLQEAIRLAPKPKAPEPKPEAKPAAAQAPAAGTTDAETAPEAATGETRAAPAEATTPTEAGRLVVQAAVFLRGEDAANPVPYRLLRALRWGGLAQAPPNEQGKTRLPAPRAQRVTYLTGLLEKADHEALIAEAEASFQESPFHFWLGLQRLLASAMEALGEPYRAAAEAVVEETALLVRRLPALPALTFSDGTAFADPMTLEWLETKVAPLLAGDAGSGPGAAAGGGSDHVEAQYQQARQKLGAGDLPGALALMQEGSAQDTADEDRFRRRLYLAVLCVRGNQADVARAVLERLDDEVAHYALDAWNPALTLEVWATLYQCYTMLGKTAKPPDKAPLAERAAQVLDKISRLDAAYALTMLGRT